MFENKIIKNIKIIFKILFSFSKTMQKKLVCMRNIILCYLKKKIIQACKFFKIKFIIIIKYSLICLKYKIQFYDA